MAKKDQNQLWMAGWWIYQRDWSQNIIYIYHIYKIVGKYDEMMPMGGGWKSYIEKFADNIDTKTIMIWHSAWAAAIVRRLWENSNIYIDKLILVAPWYIADPNPPSISSQTGKAVNPNDYDWLRDLYDFDIDASIRDRINNIYILTSNDSERLLQSADIYIHKLSAKHIYIPDRWHFNSSYGDGNQNKELLEIFEIIK